MIINHLMAIKKQKKRKLIKIFFKNQSIISYKKIGTANASNMHIGSGENLQTANEKSYTCHAQKRIM